MIDFAAIESLTNTSVLAVMGNATMTWGAFSADGVFRKPSALLLGDLVQGDHPTFTALTSLVGSLSYGTAVTVAAVNYTVARNEPDGTGTTVLTLKNA